MSLTCYQNPSMTKPCEAGKDVLEYNRAISPVGIHFTFFRNALVGRPAEKLILRLKEKKCLCDLGGSKLDEKKGERVLHVQKHNKLRATTLSDLETFNIKSVNK